MVSSGSSSRHRGVIQPRGGALAVPPVGFSPAGSASRSTAKSSCATGLLATNQSRATSKVCPSRSRGAVGRELEVEAHEEWRRRLRRHRLDHVPVGHHEVGAHQEAGAQRPPRRRLDAAHGQLRLTQSRAPLRDVREPGPEDALLEVRLVRHCGGQMHALGELSQRRVLRSRVASLDDRPLERDELRVARRLGAGAVDQRIQPPLRFRPRDQPEDDVVERAFAGDDGEVLVEMELDETLQRRGTRKGVPERGMQRLLLATVERVHVLVR